MKETMDQDQMEATLWDRIGISAEALTGAADVWGIGVVLFEALSGADAFGGDEEYPQLLSPAPDLRTLRGDLPPALAEVVAACLAPDPAARPSIAGLLARLEPAPDLRSARWLRDGFPRHEGREGTVEASLASLGLGAITRMLKRD